MLDGLLLAKTVVTGSVVIGLSILAERAGPRIAGVLAGLPLGTAILYFFIGLEQGPGFVVAAAGHTLGGLIATLALCYAYWQASRHATDPARRLRGLARACLAALPAFGLAAWLLSLLELGFAAAAGLTLVAIAAAMAAMHAIPEQAMVRRVRLTPLMLLVRAGTAVAVVLAVTGTADLIGPHWAGLLSGFPLTFFPLLLVIHASYSAQHAHGLLRNFPFGLGSVTAYIVCAHFAFGALGVVAGSAVSMAAGLAYLLAYWLVSRALRPRRGGGAPA
ncbi:hypothetical protein ACFOGJ_28665 [Marinibaculum pumilum]|uniref:Uncharacterized protein n=1 Tax=Marinibaculum pumilum TaxID=1766165 RepID=A0ABV7LAD4_9PROT